MDEVTKTEAQRPSGGTLSWVGEAEMYLKERGWTFAGMDRRNMPLYSDPNGSNEPAVDLVDVELPNGTKRKVWKPRVTTPVTVKTKEGNEETYGQLVLQPIPWVYPVEEAYGLQLQREEQAKREKTEADRPKPKGAHQTSPQLKRKVG